MNETRMLYKEIECVKSCLGRFIENKELADPAVVYISQVLDKLLNKYQNIVSIKHETK